MPCRVDMTEQSPQSDLKSFRVSSASELEYDPAPIPPPASYGFLRKNKPSTWTSRFCILTNLRFQEAAEVSSASVATYVQDASAALCVLPWRTRPRNQIWKTASSKASQNTSVYVRMLVCVCASVCNSYDLLVCVHMQHWICPALGQISSFMLGN